MSSQPCLLTYDIPDDSGFPNPSNLLRERGARLEKSVWVIHEDNIPPRLIVDMNEAGCSVNVVHFDPKEAEKVTLIATRAITLDIRSTVKRHQTAAEQAVLNMQTARKPAAECYITCRKKLRPIIKRMGKKLTQLKSAATCFGLSFNSLRGYEAITAMQTLQEATLRHAKTFLETAAAIEKVQPGSLIAKAARNGKVPKWVLADYADDMGIDTTKLRLSMF